MKSRSKLLVAGVTTLGALVAGLVASAQNLDVKGTATTEGQAFFYQSVGVGATDPTYSGRVASRLSVSQADGNTGLAIGNSTTPRFAVNGNGNGSWTAYDYAAGYWSSGITQASGNVGIGGSPVSYGALDVNTSGNKSIHTMDGTYGGLLIGFQGSTIQGRTTADGNGNLALEAWGGNVGIGTTTPTGKLEVNLANPSGWSGNLKALRMFAPDNGYYLDVNTYVVTGGNVGYQFSPNGNTGLSITTPGYVGIGTMTPASALDVNGGLTTRGGVSGFYFWDRTWPYQYAWYAHDGYAFLWVNYPGYAADVVKVDGYGNMWAKSFNATSSRDYKKDIEHLSSAAYDKMLRDVSHMSLAAYRFKDESESAAKHIGFIAEEMPKAVVAKDGKAVSVYELISYSLGAVKALKAEKDRLQDEVKALRAEVRRISAAQ